jgi:hypothetical protein
VLLACWHAGVFSFDSADGQAVQLSLIKHDLEKQPLPYQSTSIDYVFLLEVGAAAGGILRQHCQASSRLNGLSG